MNLIHADLLRDRIQEWRENHDDESVRRNHAVVYGGGRILQEPNGDHRTEATLWAVVDSVFGQAVPEWAKNDLAIKLCLTGGR